MENPRPEIVSQCRFVQHYTVHNEFAAMLTILNVKSEASRCIFTALLPDCAIRAGKLKSKLIPIKRSGAAQLPIDARVVALKASKVIELVGILLGDVCKKELPIY